MSTREASQPLYQSSVPTSSKTRQGLSEALLQSRPHKEPSPLSSNRTGLLNFSFYSRPLAVARAAMLRYGEPASMRLSGGASSHHKVSGGSSSNMVNLAISKANSGFTKEGNHKLRGKKKMREQLLDVSTKRTRAADVHNLSERRRRDRINEKITALQKLIPNCNKADKASILEDTIKYVKTVQLQLQMIYNQCRLTNPLVMPPAGMQLLKMPTMSPFSPMDLGMGKGTELSYGMGKGTELSYGIGMYDSNNVQHFPVPPRQEQFAPRLMGMQASIGFPMYGMLGKELPMPMPMPVRPPVELPTKASSITEISIPNTKLAASDLTLYSISKDQQHRSADN